MIRVSSLKRKKPRLSKCRVCRGPFEKRNSLHVACGTECALTIAKTKREKAERKELKVRKDALKSRSDWLKDTQAAFNLFIRSRDHLNALPCISCGRDNDCKINAGHYLSVGAHPELRFNEDNCHKQCEHCNTYKSGNQAEYRPRLIERIGLDRVIVLEGPHEPVKYTIDELKELKAAYRQKTKELLSAAK